jgi:hypothetical protein
MRVQDTAVVRSAIVSCNVKIVSGARTSQIESAYARAINRIARVMQRSACKTCRRFPAREGRIRSVLSKRSSARRDDFSPAHLPLAVASR